MTNNFPIVTISLVLDSLIVGLALGAALAPRQRRRVAVAFGACDGLASLLGWSLGAPLWHGLPSWCDWLGPVALAAYGIGVLALAWRGRELADRGQLAVGGWLALALPLCLSLDNLATGTGSTGSMTVTIFSCLGFAVVSGLLGFAGMAMGDAVVRRFQPRADWLSGSALVAVAAGMVLKDYLF